MNLLAQAIQDISDITSNPDEYAIPVEFIKDDVSVIVNCIKNKIMVQDDTKNVPAVAERTTVAVAEQLLISAGLTVRNADGLVDMERARVNIGTEKYMVKMQMPDQTFGLLVFILEDYQ